MSFSLIDAAARELQWIMILAIVEEGLNKSREEQVVANHCASSMSAELRALLANYEAALIVYLSHKVRLLKLRRAADSSDFRVQGITKLAEIQALEEDVKRYRRNKSRIKANILSHNNQPANYEMLHINHQLSRVWFNSRKLNGSILPVEHSVYEHTDIHL